MDQAKGYRRMAKDVVNELREAECGEPFSGKRRGGGYGWDNELKSGELSSRCV